MRSIAVSSGKGGVGKTSVALNLGIILAQNGKKVVVIDGDVSMANVGIMLGVERVPLNLHHVLLGETDIRDAMYAGPHGMYYVPSGLSMERIAKLNFDLLKEGVSELARDMDFILIDCPPGLSTDARAALLSANELLLILTPDPASLADSMKVLNFAIKNNMSIAGVVENMVLNDRSEIKRDDLETLLATKIVQSIPEDVEMRKSAAAQVPLVIKNPRAPSAQALRDLAAFLLGAPVKAGASTNVKKGIIARILDAIGSLFRRKQ